ncbi:MAG: hypothetical protein KIS66_14225 [Fimbriimonadaceae bacterium]|nr:hypothetical protein [Fimbriimonadaceae bacterium]
MLGSKTVAVSIPLVAFAGIAAFVGVQVGQLRRLEAEQSRLQQSVRKLEFGSKTVAPVVELEQAPIVPSGEREQAAFLEELRLAASQNGVELVKWNLAVQKPVASPTSKSVSVPDASGIDCQIEVAGTYQDLRAFLYDLAKGQRFYAFGNVNWRRDRDRYPKTSLRFTLTRFVTGPAESFAKNPAPGETG